MNRLTFALPALLCFLAVTLTTAAPLAADEQPARQPSQNRPIIDVTHLDMVRARRPLLIAHRGGVVTPQTPECSPAAIRLAAQLGYDMVELDVQQSRDAVPIVFHDRSLKNAVGVDSTIAELTAAEAVKLRYAVNDETLATLDDDLALCKSLSLGVMLDIKRADADCLDRIAALVRKHDLAHSIVTINGDPLIQRKLKPVSLIRLTDVNTPVADDADKPLAGYFWFGLPKDLPIEKIAAWQKAGALVVPGVNTFRYPREQHRVLAAKDIKRLRAVGVDGFQIDSVYQDLFGLPADAE